MAISPECGSRDTFEWLALMDVLGFEDFEFTALCGQLTPLMLGLPQTGLLKFSLASGNRFFLIGDGDAQSDPCFRSSDIACFYSSMPLVAGDVLIARAEHFNALVRQGVRTCLLYRCEGQALGRELEECTDAAVRIEWETPYMHAEEQRSGLILSSGWREGIREHAVNLIANYMHTCARSGDALTHRPCLEETGER
ncbi:hypothetical protein [Xanthomonas sp. GPE 39]|uniref:hypothetical protein n=1 Tax=Xanthomonas sp. GPE 39 TaxID=1583099 RepID=UPI000A940307|nr:hypothetical protein [Xanthomonas sp. GPE 39]